MRLKKTKSQTKEKQGFTLIELLVVISIIALLMAILIPALQKAKVVAEKVICGSNLHQLSLMCQLYALDYDGYLPPAAYNIWSSTGGSAHAMQLSWYYNQALFFYENYKDFCTVASCPNIRGDGTLEAHIKGIRDDGVWSTSSNVYLGYYYLGGILDTPFVDVRYKTIPWETARTLPPQENDSYCFRAGSWPGPYPSNYPTFPASPVKNTDKGGLYLAADCNHIFGSEQDPDWGYVGDQLRPGDKYGLAWQVGHLKTGGGVTAYRLGGWSWPDYRKWKILPIASFAGGNHLYHDSHVEWKDWRELYARNYANFWALDKTTRR